MHNGWCGRVQEPTARARAVIRSNYESQVDPLLLGPFKKKRSRIARGLKTQLPLRVRQNPSLSASKSRTKPTLILQSCIQANQGHMERGRCFSMRFVRKSSHRSYIWSDVLRGELFDVSEGASMSNNTKKLILSWCFLCRKNVLVKVNDYIWVELSSF